MTAKTTDQVSQGDPLEREFASREGIYLRILTTMVAKPPCSSHTDELLGFVLAAGMERTEWFTAHAGNLPSIVIPSVMLATG